MESRFSAHLQLRGAVIAVVRIDLFRRPDGAPTMVNALSGFTPIFFNDVHFVDLPADVNFNRMLEYKSPWGSDKNPGLI
ncbi:hypothetical protein GLYMA_20G171500v4 [Glycine max]|uniref:Uncharacterized protein n=1 Tax=Glycine max TaxID=3847 RepID=A0A0R0EMI4_SOYBN|nr:hypothetical protein GYH30_056146 [Glycine max]KRG91729.1 hypothetical protein GLYMA_20G171500v4 [Glycine max]